MRLLEVTAALALLSMTACSGRVLVATHDPVEAPPHPAPPHRVQGPVASLAVPPGHFPPAGQCRIWLPGRSPGHQPRPVPCHALGPVPLGAWVLHRPAADQNVLEVSEYDKVRAQIIVSVAYYDAATGVRVDARVTR